MHSTQAPASVNHSTLTAFFVPLLPTCPWLHHHLCPFALLPGSRHTTRESITRSFLSFVQLSAFVKPVWNTSPPLLRLSPHLIPLHLQGASSTYSTLTHVLLFCGHLLPLTPAASSSTVCERRHRGSRTRAEQHRYHICSPIPPSGDRSFTSRSTVLSPCTC